MRFALIKLLAEDVARLAKSRSRLSELAQRSVLVT